MQSVSQFVNFVLHFSYCYLFWYKFCLWAIILLLCWNISLCFRIKQVKTQEVVSILKSPFGAFSLLIYWIHLLLKGIMAESWFESSILKWSLMLYEKMFKNTPVTYSVVVSYPTWLTAISRASPQTHMFSNNEELHQYWNTTVSSGNQHMLSYGREWLESNCNMGKGDEL